MLNLRDLIYNYKQSNSQIPISSSQLSQPIQQTLSNNSDSDTIFSPYKTNNTLFNESNKSLSLSNSNSQNNPRKSTSYSSSSSSINNRKINNVNNELENDIDDEYKSEDIGRKSRYKISRYDDAIPLIGKNTLFSNTYNETPEIKDVSTSNQFNRQFIYFVPGMSDYHQFRYPKFSEGNITNWLRVLCDQCYYGNDYNGAAMIYKVLSKLTPMNDTDIQRLAIMLKHSTNSFTHLKQFAQEIMSSPKAHRKIDLIISGNFLILFIELFVGGYGDLETASRFLKARIGDISYTNLSFSSINAILTILNAINLTVHLRNNNINNLKSPTLLEFLCNPMMFYSYVNNIFKVNTNESKRILTDIRQSLNSVTTLNKEGVDLQALSIGYLIGIGQKKEALMQVNSSFLTLQKNKNIYDIVSIKHLRLLLQCQLFISKELIEDNNNNNKNEVKVNFLKGKLLENARNWIKKSNPSNFDSIYCGIILYRLHKLESTELIEIICDSIERYPPPFTNEITNNIINITKKGYIRSKNYINHANINNYKIDILSSLWKTLMIILGPIDNNNDNNNKIKKFQLDRNWWKKNILSICQIGEFVNYLSDKNIEKILKSLNEDSLKYNNNNIDIENEKLLQKKLSKINKLKLLDELSKIISNNDKINRNWNFVSNFPYIINSKKEKKLANYLNNQDYNQDINNERIEKMSYPLTSIEGYNKKKINTGKRDRSSYNDIRDKVDKNIFYSIKGKFLDVLCYQIICSAHLQGVDCLFVTRGIQILFLHAYIELNNKAYNNNNNDDYNDIYNDDDDDNNNNNKRQRDDSYNNNFKGHAHQCLFILTKFNINIRNSIKLSLIMYLNSNDIYTSSTPIYYAPKSIYANIESNNNFIYDPI